MSSTTIFNENLPLIFLGDHHGAWSSLIKIFEEKNLDNCSIVSVGDLGIGFNYTKEIEKKACEKLNTLFEKKNIHFFGIRGNHDDPYFFSEKNRVCLSNFELIEDYTVCSYRNKTIQFIGGAISIDRTGRREGVSYWSNEGVFFKKNNLKKCDILITHTAPSWCFPQNFNEIVYGWAREDAYLIEDLNEERSLMDEIFKTCKPSVHLYGHFHSSWTEEINDCMHKLLNINELWELKI